MLIIISGCGCGCGGMKRAQYGTEKEKAEKRELRLGRLMFLLKKNPTKTMFHYYSRERERRRGKERKNRRIERKGKGVMRVRKEENIL